MPEALERVGAEARLRELGLTLPSPPTPFGAYKEAVRSGNLLFLSGMLPTQGRDVLVSGRLGESVCVDEGRFAARIAALNALALIRKALGSLDRVRRIVRLGVLVAATEEAREHPRVADGASELFEEVFGSARNPCRLVVGVVSLPLGATVALELILEVEDEGISRPGGQ